MPLPGISLLGYAGLVLVSILGPLWESSGRRWLRRWTRKLAQHLQFSVVNGNRGEILHGSRWGLSISVTIESADLAWVECGDVDWTYLPNHMAWRADGGSKEGGGLKTGDDQFDKFVEIGWQSGDQAVALLSQEMRNNILCLFYEHPGTISFGAYSFSPVAVKDPKKARDIVDKFIDLCRTLKKEMESIPQSHLRNVREDPVNAVRLNNLKALQKHYGNSPETQEAVQIALKDDDAEIVLTAAVSMGDKGLPALEKALDPALPGLVISAVEKFVLCATPEKLGPILVAGLRSRELLVCQACASALGAIGYRSGIAPLIALGEKEDPDTQLAVIRALEKLGDSSAEDAIILWLKVSEENVRLAAARALGSLGTAAAVEPLLSLIKGFVNTEIERVARAAIGQIQSRLGPAERGTLALAAGPGEGGDVSLAGPGGDVSLHQEGGDAKGKGES